MRVEEIIEALGSLTGDERNQIRAVLKLLAPGDSGAASSRHDSAPEMIWDAVREVAGPHFPPYSGMKRTAFFRKMREGAQLTENYSVRFMPRMTKTERIATYRHMVRALFIWMDRSEIPITPRTVAMSLASIPQAVDDQFPGYAEAGRLSWALTLIAEGE